MKRCLLIVVGPVVVVLIAVVGRVAASESRGRFALSDDVTLSHTLERHKVNGRIEFDERKGRNRCIAC